MAVAIAMITVVGIGGLASTFAMLANCQENMPAAGGDGCRWLEDDDGWIRLSLFASAAPAIAAFVAYWTRRAWLLPVATLVALAVSVGVPFYVVN